MAQRTSDRPVDWVKFPIECLEKVQYWFEGVVGPGFRFDDSVIEGEDERQVVGVEKEVNSEGSQRRKRSGS